MIAEKIIDVLSAAEFLYAATCDFKGRPNIAPKFLVKIDKNFIFLVDFVIGRTWENLKANPRASLSFMDMDSLTGYQVNGTVEIITQGKEYDMIIKELQEKEISFTAKRIIEGIHKGKKSASFEVSFSKQMVIFKVKAEEVVEIGPSGKVSREKV
ncbi:MAG: pyridoxamine 5'-phosphate oxidase family protein [Candidatus Omnitrophota bacterium]|jgi:predicted pyridoxine 5'-phosphate oxidase superfamily flavin-nucleotide-binding protein